MASTCLSYDTGENFILSQPLLMKMVPCLMESGRQEKQTDKIVGWLFCSTGWLFCPTRCTQHLWFSKLILISCIGNISGGLVRINLIQINNPGC